MKDTAFSERLNIVIFGECNSGKSSLLNAITGQEVTIVSPYSGTTTDQVSKPMELPGVGACLFVDTAGVNDSSALGEARKKKSELAFREADILLAVIDGETRRVPKLPDGKINIIPIVNKSEQMRSLEKKTLAAEIKEKYGKAPIEVSPITGKGLDLLMEAIKEAVPDDWKALPLTEGIAGKGDVVVLVMPQDEQAPKGRLILPQQQTIRELIDRGCITVCTDTENLSLTLASLKEAPAAIITDSQAFAQVKPLTPEGTVLSSFSILLAASKGDIEFFKAGAKRIDSLEPESKVLIAEACTHVPAGEDIGRVQIPRLLRKKAGESLQIDIVSGRDFPADLSAYDLVIQCGACMYNRRYVMSRIAQARAQGVPMTNYGVAIAYINNIL